MITITQFRAICPSSPKNIDVFLPYLNDFMPEFGIDTPDRQAMFIAQVAHESGGFRYVREIASGRAYEGRKDLGNNVEGDGVKYKGRGLVQITGKANYKQCGDDLGLDLIRNPELLEVPEYAVKSACWYWKRHNLNRFADTGDIEGCTRVINGGLNGIEDRKNYYERAKNFIGK